jgi:subtilisin family serine protease
MATVEVLVEVDRAVDDALTTFAAAGASLDEGRRQVERVLPDVPGVKYRHTAKPVPMFTPPVGAGDRLDGLSALSAFASPEPSRDLACASQVVSVQAEPGAVEELAARPGVRVWPSSPLTFHVDCPPFRAAVGMDEIRAKLGVDKIWETGARGMGVTVGVVDMGVDGSIYPISGGYARVDAQQPGTASTQSHGSMCAADVLLAAPEARLYDYPFLVPRSGGAIVMLNAVLEQRRRDGTPHIITNSWGFYSVPSRAAEPNHEVWDIDHPLHRKVREVAASGALITFAAGNCGGSCPAGNCDVSSIGPGKSIHGSNSLAEVLTVAAVNVDGERIGYSSEGPGMFEPSKPDVAAYSHFFGNFGPGRPGGDAGEPFDNGTSAACPVTAGVLALLLSAKPGATPAELRDAVVAGADGDGAWNAETGHGVVNAAASFARLSHP